MAHDSSHQHQHGTSARGVGPLIIAVAVIGYLIGAVTRPSVASSGADLRAVAGPGYYEPLPAAGPADAPVVVTMVSDFRCPFCATKITQLKRLMLEHRDVRFVFKYLGAVRDPEGSGLGTGGLFTRSESAAIAAMAANRQGRFWEYADQLFLHQKDRGAWNREYFVQYAKNIGLDVARFEDDLSDRSLRSFVRKDAKAGELLGVNATPSVFVNGRRVSNLADALEFRQTIREARDAVTQLMARGYTVEQARAMDAADQHVAGQRFAQLFIDNDVLDLTVDLR